MATAFRTITARYRGTCRRCHDTITAGTRIRYGGRGLTYHLAAECGAGDEGEDNRSHKARFGHCEDAPCCGCCGPGTDDPRYATHEPEYEYSY